MIETMFEAYRYLAGMFCVVFGLLCFILGALCERWNRKTKRCPTCKGDGWIKRKRK